MSKKVKGWQLAIIIFDLMGACAFLALSIFKIANIWPLVIFGGAAIISLVAMFVKLGQFKLPSKKLALKKPIEVRNLLWILYVVLILVATGYTAKQCYGYAKMQTQTVESKEENPLVTPGAVENVTPGAIENVTPGAIENVTPGAVENVTPGAVENVTPGAIENVTPGAVENVTPGAVTSGSSVEKSNEQIRNESIEALYAAISRLEKGENLTANEKLAVAAASEGIDFTSIIEAKPCNENCIAHYHLVEAKQVEATTKSAVKATPKPTKAPTPKPTKEVTPKPTKTPTPKPEETEKTESKINYAPRSYIYGLLPSYNDGDDMRVRVQIEDENLKSFALELYVSNFKYSKVEYDLIENSKKSDIVVFDVIFKNIKVIDENKKCFVYAPEGTGIDEEGLKTPYAKSRIFTIKAKEVVKEVLPTIEISKPNFSEVYNGQTIRYYVTYKDTSKITLSADDITLNGFIANVSVEATTSSSVKVVKLSNVQGSVATGKSITIAEKTGVSANGKYTEKVTSPTFKIVYYNDNNNGNNGNNGNGGNNNNNNTTTPTPTPTPAGPTPTPTEPADPAKLSVQALLEHLSGKMQTASMVWFRVYFSSNLPLKAINMTEASISDTNGMLNVLAMTEPVKQTETSWYVDICTIAENFAMSGDIHIIANVAVDEGGNASYSSNSVRIDIKAAKDPSIPDENDSNEEDPNFPGNEGENHRPVWNLRYEGLLKQGELITVYGQLTDDNINGMTLYTDNGIKVNNATLISLRWNEASLSFEAEILLDTIGPMSISVPSNTAVDSNGQGNFEGSGLELVVEKVNNQQPLDESDNEAEVNDNTDDTVIIIDDETEGTTGNSDVEDENSDTEGDLDDEENLASGEEPDFSR